MVEAAFVRGYTNQAGNGVLTLFWVGYVLPVFNLIMIFMIAAKHNILLAGDWMGIFTVILGGYN